MPFSLGSYLLGVGTVVGALAFGFGSGVLLTNTAMKEPAAAPTRIERVARSEPERPAQQDTKENPAPPTEAAPAAHPDPAPKAQAATPQFDAPGETESAKQPQPTKQAELAKPGKSANDAEQREAPQKRTAERKVDRQQHYTEQKAKSSFAASRTRQPPSEQQDEPERTGFWLGREEPHFDLFPTPSPPPFVRSYDWAPFDRDD
jgi:hypothetical protein